MPELGKDAFGYRVVADVEGRELRCDGPPVGLQKPVGQTDTSPG